MLQRAASNAYSWWWASHIRTKQSKWLEENLQDMEEKVTTMLRIIENKGDSFAQRAEMYYRKRPELIAQVEEAYRAYRALAERYDHLSKDMQSANRTIAAVFPEQFQFATDDDDYVGSSSASPDEINKVQKESKTNIPRAPTMTKEFQSQSMLLSRKEEQQLGRTASLPAKSTAATPKSGLTSEEATEEIDKIQKEILALQTEREFIQSIYIRCSEKCNGIDNQITDMQTRVSSLQDEFGFGNVIDDNEARTLMAATALKSCKDTLVKLQEKQEQSAEEAKLENRRVKDLVKKFTNLQGEFHSNKTDVLMPYGEQETESDDLNRHDIELLQQKLKKDLEADDSSSTVMQLAERIDELVEKVVNLETSVSSQKALVNVLRSEADVLQERIKTLEEEKEILMENSEIMSNKIKELEEELRRVKSLNQNVQEQNNNLQADVTKASCNIDHLSEKLENVKADEEVDNAGMHKEMEASPDAEVDKDKKVDISIVSNLADEEESELRENLDVMPENHQALLKNEKEELLEMDNDLDNQPEELGTDGEEEHPNRNHLLAGGIEDREKHLVQEYTLVLRNYKGLRKRLCDVEKKNRDGFFELALQIRELKNALAVRDEQIQTLQKMNSLQKREDENPQTSPESIIQAPSISDFNQSTLSSPQQQISDSEHHVESRGPMSRFSNEDIQISPKDNRSMKNIDTCRVASAIEEKLRSDIDGLLEENLEFWLRFSSSFHQIQKYQTSVQDLKAEISKLKDSKMQDGSGKGQCIMSEARPIYIHLREIQTELTLWLETNSVLKDELQGRHASLCSIQEELSRVSKASIEGGEAELSECQAAKFQGEILNMKQENNKVSDELQAGLERVNVLKDEVEKILSKMDEELKLSAAKQRPQRARIPLRSFLFGVKLKRNKSQNQRASLFSCTSPAFLEHGDAPEAGPPQ